MRERLLLLTLVAVPGCADVVGIPDWYGVDGGLDYAQAVLADQPIDYFRLDETSGETAASLGSGKHDGKYMGDVGHAPGFVAGSLQSAHFKNDPNMVVQIGNVFDFASRAHFTIEAWVYLASDDYEDGAGFIVDKLTSASPSVGWALYVDSFPRLHFERNTSDGPSSPGEAFALSIDATHHLVATYDGAEACVHVDGVRQCTEDDGALVMTSAPLRFGSSFAGSLDEVAIYNGALDPSRIEQHYAAGKKP